MKKTTMALMNTNKAVPEQYEKARKVYHLKLFYWSSIESKLAHLPIV